MEFGQLPLAYSRNCEIHIITVECYPICSNICTLFNSLDLTSACILDEMTYPLYITDFSRLTSFLLRLCIDSLAILFFASIFVHCRLFSTFSGFFFHLSNRSVLLFRFRNQIFSFWTPTPFKWLSVFLSIAS